MPSLIEDYCRLLPSDSDACAALFADEAVFTTMIGAIPGSVQGREAIRDLLARAPAEATFAVLADGAVGMRREAVIEIRQRDGSVARQTVRYTIDGERFSQFTVIPEGNPDVDEMADLPYMSGDGT